MDATFSFTAELWRWSAKESTTWIFVTVPADDADMIREMVPTKRGFGSVPVAVRIGDTAWRTSVFPHKESGSYVLPLKKAVRVAEGLELGGSAEVELTIRPD